MGSAFGVSATGLVTIAPTPTDNTLATIDRQPLLTARALSASSTPNATGVTSTASVADVNALAGSIRATLLASTCTANGAALTGGSTFTDLALSTAAIPVPGLPPIPAAPIPVPTNPAPNTKITIPGVATVVLNEQITSADRQTLTVNAVRITTLVPGVTQEVTIADSVCTLASTTASTTPTSSTPATTPTGSTPATTPTGSTPATTPTGSTPATTPTGSTPATTPTGSTPATTRGSSGTGTAPGATPVQGRPAFTG